MYLFKIASFMATPLAATADEIRPWMIAAIAAGALLALILIIVAARRAKGPKGEDLREAMVAAKQEAVENRDAFGEGARSEAVSPVVPASATQKKKTTKPTKGKHAR